MKNQLIKKIASYSKDYKNYLKTWNKDNLQNDWSYALKFFFNKTFYRGRSDRLSALFEKRANEVIDKIIGKDKSFNKLQSDLKNLNRKLKENSVSNFADRGMIESIIIFLSSIPLNNIISYSLNQIKNSKIKQHYGELSNLYFVGDKLITFYFRDLDYIFNLNKYFIKEDYLFLQPIDTWVRQISKKIGITDDEKDLEKIKTKIIDACHNAGVNPSDYNLGAWFVGSRKIFPFSSFK